MHIDPRVLKKWSSGFATSSKGRVSIKFVDKLVNEAKADERSLDGDILCLGVGQGGRK